MWLLIGPTRRKLNVFCRLSALHTRSLGEMIKSNLVLIPMYCTSSHPSVSEHGLNL